MHPKVANRSTSNLSTGCRASKKNPVVAVTQCRLQLVNVGAGCEQRLHRLGRKHANKCFEDFLLRRLQNLI
jgi:hypothetical protein